MKKHRRRRIWIHDEVGTISYNVICALEVTLMNLDISNWHTEWLIEEVEIYLDKYEVLRDGSQEEGTF